MLPSAVHCLSPEGEFGQADDIEACKPDRKRSVSGEILTNHGRLQMKKTRGVATEDCHAPNLNHVI